MRIRTRKIIADFSAIPYIIYSATFQKIKLQHLKELVYMNYEITPRNRAREFFHQIRDKLENFLFWIIQKLPERFIPTALMSWSVRYLNKRIHHLKQETIRQNWNKAHLDQALKEIHSRQQAKEKAPSGE